MLAMGLGWLVVVLHVLFGLGESVGWSRMAGRLGLDATAVENTRSLAMNQGAYNAGFAALLAWSLATGQAATTIALLVFIVAMAIVGALTVRWTIFVIQGLPAILALAASFLG